jgi:hypothetical protein
MAQLVYAFQVTIPAGTAISAKFSQAISFPPAVVDQIAIRVPTGPLGSMGFALGSSGTPVIPYNVGAWLVMDGESLSWDVDSQFDSGAWQLFGYNTDFWDHTVYLRFLCSLVSDASAAAGPIVIPVEALSSPGSPGG